ncbi:hypothetical protein Q7P37_006249 [Cladosporium fusiforme]
MPRNRRPQNVNSARFPLGTPTLPRTISPTQHSPVTSTQPTFPDNRIQEHSPSSPGIYAPTPARIFHLDTPPQICEIRPNFPKALRGHEEFERSTRSPVYKSHRLPPTSHFSTSKTPKVDESPVSQQDLNMASSHSSDSQQPLSLAEAKLKRQNERIATANAAITTHAPAEKQKQRKAKAWKPFDFSTEMQSSAQSQPTGPGLVKVESRVNVFRAPSQGALLSRPLSRISTHTQQSTASESDRRDSSFLEADDFQLFTGRRKSRPVVGTSEDKPSTQHATIEATFCKRAITEVFGNELPGPAFMDSTPGATNGHLQFIQHPNGDVSAHQWSSSRFGWENIGQFSNIRKKIEGQLAACRLKGETASQAVQQNTLAYFRAVAKQRESDVMGLPFGPKEIAACLPDTRPPSTAPTGPRRVTSKVEMPERPSTMMPRQDTLTSHTVVVGDTKAAAMPPKPASDHLQRPQSQAPQIYPRFNPALNFTPKPVEHQHEDPFISAAPYQDVYGGGGGAGYDHHMSSLQGSYYPQWAPPMQYNYGPPSTSMHSNGYFGQSYVQPPPAFSTDQTNLADQIARVRLNQTSVHESPQQNFGSTHIVAPQPTLPVARPLSPQQVIPPVVQSKPASPLETREAMREHVMKMGEQAKERTKSQANIRTVLYDPFQDQPQKSQIPQSEEEAPKPARNDTLHVPVRQPIGPPALPHQHAQTNNRLPALGLNKTPGLGGLGGDRPEPFPTTLAPSVKMPFNSPLAVSEDDLPETSPERKRDFQRAPGKFDSKPLMSMLTSSSPPSSSRLDQWNPEDLDDWYWGGTKFARQNGFNDSIEASDTTPHRRKKPPIIKPIALPSRQKPTTDNTPHTNFLTTRHLIPVLENLAQYVQGPVEKRRDYFCQWVKAPEWAIDRSSTGNDSFFDSQWGQPPARIGRDPRYQPLPRSTDMRFGSFHDPARGQNVSMPGMDRRFGFGW